MALGQTTASRRQFMLAASGQALLIGQTGAASSQEAFEPTKEEIDGARRVFAKLNNVEELPEAFLRVFDIRLDLSLGTIEKAAREETKLFVEAAVKRFLTLQKDLSLDKLAVNSIRLQNVMFAMSTRKDGRVNIAQGAVAKASSSLCPLYPFC